MTTNTVSGDGPVLDRQVMCLNCIYRSKNSFGTTINEKLKFLCQRNPPQMLPIGDFDDDTNRLPARPMSPVVRQNDWCGQFVHRETRKSFDNIHEIE